MLQSCVKGLGGACRILFLKFWSILLTALKTQLEAIIDAENDSIRFYRLGNTYKPRIDVLGRAERIETGEPLIL